MADLPASEMGKVECVYGDFIPRLHDVRRVPTRYQRSLPLPVVKQHQCVVLGASARALTVGVIEREGVELFALLRRITGVAICPVLVEPGRMRLMIARMERCQRFRQRSSRAYYVLHLPSQARLLLLYTEREREMRRS